MIKMTTTLANRVEEAVTRQGPSREPVREIPPHRRGIHHHALLWLPCALALAAPLYNGIKPSLFGFPLFFWAQLMLIPVSSFCILAAYVGGRR